MEFIYDASYDKQIFITTHNPELYKDAKPEDIYLVSRRDNYSVIKAVKEYKSLDLFLEKGLEMDQIISGSLLNE